MPKSMVVTPEKARRAGVAEDGEQRNKGMPLPGTILGCTLRAASQLRRRSGDSGRRRGIRRGRVLRRRSCAGNLRTPAACAPPARRPRRVMAVHRFLHQPPQQLPRRHLRVDVGQQPLELLQPTLAIVIDHRLEFPPPRAQRAHPVGRRCQVRIDLGQHLLHLAGALAGRLRHQLLPRRQVQRWRYGPVRLWSHSRCRTRRRRRTVGRCHRRGRPSPGPCAARAAHA